MCGYVTGDEVSLGKIDSFGRLHTGDIGRLDRDGYLYLLRRKSDLIKSAGERVFPGELDDILDLRDGTLGEKLVAYVDDTAAVKSRSSLRVSVPRW
jgi:O-succinylbenzoic acid--CoA ligase